MDCRYVRMNPYITKRNQWDHSYLNTPFKVISVRLYAEDQYCPFKTAGIGRVWWNDGKLCDQLPKCLGDKTHAVNERWLFLNDTASTVPMTTARSAPAARTRRWSCGTSPQARSHGSSEVMPGSVRLVVQLFVLLLVSTFFLISLKCYVTESQLCPVQRGGDCHLIR